ncbi:MAG: heme biosynthesis HemY N-terminal domain-containing protein [Limnobacter sp.]|nr:heme biosynthesis HemY N-terminal domain-containing protein [Limnobacter sp.]
MKNLISLSVVVALAVVLTLVAKFNPGKVAIFLSEYRIDFSLNFAIVLFFVAFASTWIVFGAFRASGKMPARVRGFLSSRKQKILMEANTKGIIALITGDEALAEKSLRNAQKTGIESDLSYLIRALSALQADRYDVADELLSQNPAGRSDHADVIQLLKAKVALSKTNFELALELANGLPPSYSRYPQTKRIRILALVGLSRWAEALNQYRQSDGVQVLEESEREEALGKIYTGLCAESAGKADRVKTLAKEARHDELALVSVLEPLTKALMQEGMVNIARKTLENSLAREMRLDVLPLYQWVASVESREALPFVEKLVADNPGEVRLMELAADVCEREQLWGKAISGFERVYQKQASAHVAGRLERLYELANQPEKSRLWHEKLKVHLVQSSQVA